MAFFNNDRLLIFFRAFFFPGESFCSAVHVPCSLASHSHFPPLSHLVKPIRSANGRAYFAESQRQRCVGESRGCACDDPYQHLKQLLREEKMKEAEDLVLVLLDGSCPPCFVIETVSDESIELLSLSIALSLWPQ
jgi:hypothetical protein